MAERTIGSNRLVDWEFLEQIRALPDSTEWQALAKEWGAIINRDIWTWEGTVSSVNNINPDAQGNITLDTDDIPEGTNKYTTQADIDKLAGIASGAEVNVQSDWNETDTWDDAFIQNKPDVGIVGTRSVNEANIADGRSLVYNQANNRVQYDDRVESIVAGTGITVDATDPQNPSISVDLDEGWVTSEMVATSGQTVFNEASGIDFDLPSSKNDFLVFVDNILADVIDFSRTGTREITFGSGLNTNQVVRVAVTWGGAGWGDGADLSQVSQQAIPKREWDVLVDSAMTETSNTIVSTKSIMTPDASVGIGNWQVSNGGFTIQLEELASGRIFYPVASELESGGSTVPSYWKLAWETTTAAVADKSETFTGTSIQFVTQSVNSGIVTRYTYDSVVETADVNFVVRLNSHTDATPIFDYERATWGRLTLQTWENNLDLPVALFFEQWTNLYVTIESANNIQLRGQTISGQTIPYLESFGRLAIQTDILDENSTVSGSNVSYDDTDATGLLNGVSNVQNALDRFDSTGIGSAIFRFQGSYSAQNSNINEWFGDRQLTRLRCTSNGGVNPVIFTLPWATALGNAFDQLVTDGLPEVITFVIEYTGTTSAFVRVIPRSGTGNPVIQGTSAIIIRSGIGATIEITRNNGVISDYVFDAIGTIGDTSGSIFDTLKLVNPADQTWDASSTGTLPSTGVAKGNAYRVINAPSDGSWRFGEVMEDRDWVVWEGETFTSWSATPHQWFVIPAHDVRRVSALGTEFLNDVQITPVSDRNGVVRGVNYADSAGEIRLKIYDTVADYSAADLNTTGDIDEFTDSSDATGYLAIRLTGNFSTLEDTLPTLYIYSEDSGGNFTKLLNMSRDFNFLWNFWAESDYISNEVIEYTWGDTLRIYIGTDIDRYNLPNLDVNRENLSDEVQNELRGREPWAWIAEVLFSGATVRDIHVADRVEYTPWYNRGIDWRDMTQSTTINSDRYADNDLNISVNNAAFTITWFGNTVQKLVGVKLQRNDANNGEGAMVELGSWQALIRVNTSNEIQVNTTVWGGTTSWATLTALSNVTLGSGSNNFLLFEMVPRRDFNGNPIPNSYELIADFFDGTNYHECNNVNFTVTGTANGDNMWFSRSINQRGQVLEFRAINSPWYLTHNQLDSLVRQHRDDKWDFWYARLFEWHTSKQVVFTTEIAGWGVLTWTAAPTDAPDFIWQDYIDTNNKLIYKAIGTSTSGDWEVLN